MQITLNDIIYMYWNEKPKDVFLNKTLIEGLLNYVNREPHALTQGFNRGILSYTLNSN